MPRPVTIGLVQMACSAGKDENCARAEAGIKAAAKKGARIVCLQELFSTRYFCQTQDYAAFDLAEPIPGPTTDRLAKFAKQLGVALIVPIFERRAAGVYHNSAAVIDADGSLLGLYRKMHIPHDPGFEEKFYFAPGDLGFKSFDTRFARIGVLICWDQWYPEAARATALAGAEILFYPTAIGWKPQAKAEAKKYHLAWQTVQRGHAVANGLYVAAANRVGVEDGTRFWGQSFVAGPLGELVAAASEGKAENIVVTLDLAAVERTRQEWPFFRDRRIDAYADLANRFSR